MQAIRLYSRNTLHQTALATHCPPLQHALGGKAHVQGVAARRHDAQQRLHARGQLGDRRARRQGRRRAKLLPLRGPAGCMSINFAAHG